MINPVAIRLLNQQLAAPQFSTPSEVVAHMGAMQAQDYRMMRWAVGLRMRKPSGTAFLKDYNGGRIIRIHLLRGTWQLIAAEDYRWMLDLCAPKSTSVIQGWMKANKVCISEKERSDIKDIVVHTIEHKSSVTKEEIAAAIEDATGRRMDDHRLSYHLRLAELDGTLVNGDLHPGKSTYSLTAQKIKPAAPVCRDEALALLARKYFQSHSPATLEDFVWWAGLNVGDCKKGIHLLGEDIHTERWKERVFYLLNQCRTRGFRHGKTLLLPPFDEYLVGYKSRDLVLAPEYIHRAHNRNGIFYPVIARDGIICGNWHIAKERVQTDLFDKEEQIKCDVTDLEHIKDMMCGA